MKTGAPVGLRPDARQGGLLDGLDEWMSTKGFYPRIDTKLDNAGLSIGVAAWVLIRVTAGPVVGTRSCAAGWATCWWASSSAG